MTTMLIEHVHCFCSKRVPLAKGYHHHSGKTDHSEGDVNQPKRAQNALLSWAVTLLSVGRNADHAFHEWHDIVPSSVHVSI